MYINNAFGMLASHFFLYFITFIDLSIIKRTRKRSMSSKVRQESNYNENLAAQLDETHVQSDRARCEGNRPPNITSLILRLQERVCGRAVFFKCNVKIYDKNWTIRARWCKENGIFFMPFLNLDCLVIHFVNKMWLF